MSRHNSLVHNNALDKNSIKEVMKLRVLPRNHESGKKARSVAWHHFGPLYYTDSEESDMRHRESAGQFQGQQVKLVDDTRYYCRYHLLHVF